MNATLQRAGPSNGFTSGHNNVCSFCNEGFNVNNYPTKRTKCGHRLHTHCMNHWLPQTKKCPVCETPIPKWKDINNKCVVCYDTFYTDDVIMKTKCNHEFHDDCLDQLLHEKHRCPICRRNILYMHEELQAERQRQTAEDDEEYDDDNESDDDDDNDEYDEEEVEEEEEYLDEEEDQLDEEDEEDYVEEEETEFDAEEESVEEEEYYSEEENIENTCTICQQRFDDSEDPIRRTKCGHLLHIHCMNHYLPQAKKCPVCRHPIKWIDVTNKCVICLDMFHASDESQRLPCSHGCHSDCLDQLLVTKKRCPICKRKIVTVSKECVICLEDITLGEPVRRLSCEHEFHNVCVNSWLQNESTCPLCRVNVH